LTVNTDCLLTDGLNDTNLLVKGPYGLGVTMERQTKGIIIGIAYGVAIGLFIDLVTYILRHNINKAGKLLKKNYTIFKNEKLNKLDHANFKFVLIGLHESEEEAIGHDLCVETDKVTKEFMFGNFEYHEKIGDDCYKLEEIFEDHAHSVIQLVICATPKEIADTIQQLTLRYKIKQSDVMYL